MAEHQFSLQRAMGHGITRDRLVELADGIESGRLVCVPDWMDGPSGRTLIGFVVVPSPNPPSSDSSQQRWGANADCPHRYSKPGYKDYCSTSGGCFHLPCNPHTTGMVMEGGLCLWRVSRLGHAISALSVDRFKMLEAEVARQDAATGEPR